jgi:hypothetical protein
MKILKMKKYFVFLDMDFNRNIKKYKFGTETSMIKYIGTKNVIKEKEINKINHKRVIQMLDLFNSKYNCKKCCKKLRYKADQIIHCKLKHSKQNDQLTIECPELLCDKSFQTYFHLKFHLMKSHLNEKPYGCSFCLTKFYSFISLKKHCLKKHSNENILNLISYDNSIIKMETEHNNNSYLPNSIENPLSFNSDLNLKYFSYLNNIKDSNNFETLIDYLNENKCQSNLNLNTNTFTIITQLNLINCNLCKKLSFSNAEHQSHIWLKHLPHNHKNNICWTCVYSNKNDSFQQHTYNQDYQLEQHLKEKHSNLKSFKCSICIKDNYFNDLNLVKQHFLTEHANQAAASSYLEEIIDLATNFDETEQQTNKKISNKTTYSFVFACFKCEQIYLDYNSIVKHFEENSKCNQNKNNNLNCNKCNISVSDSKQFEIHLKQHEYLNDSFKNIKNSKNNKSYSIDAIVNSINNNRKSIDDIASKIISMKRKAQQEETFTSSNSNQILLLNKKSNNFSFNHQDENINQYNSFLNKMIKNNDSFSNNNTNHVKKPSALYASSSSSNPFCFASSSVKNCSLYQQAPLVNIQKSINPTTLIKYNNNNNNNKMNNNQFHDKILNLKQKEALYKCEYCGYSFNDVFHFNQHKTMHQAINPKRPFKCHLCQVTFAKTDQLIRHMIVHQASDQDSVCSVCYSSFSRKQDLDRHMLFHSR